MEKCELADFGNTAPKKGLELTYVPIYPWKLGFRKGDIIVSITGYPATTRKAYNLLRNYAAPFDAPVPIIYWSAAQKKYLLMEKKIPTRNPHLYFKEL
jgi:hypothetical protein